MNLDCGFSRLDIRSRHHNKTVIFLISFRCIPYYSLHFCTNLNNVLFCSSKAEKVTLNIIFAWGVPPIGNSPWPSCPLRRLAKPPEDCSSQVSRCAINQGEYCNLLLLSCLVGSPYSRVHANK